ncbi:MAG: zinc ribbon domain-containing protein [Gemmatimonadetes bacterium]|nr:zinc ribbon domain-containing protein [Gemmatimonadota bacterium]MYA41346.1 zinc ribbon domain-containing protein [Gemmatimonadota bacterium]MYJ10586.1 zinc ribbon domain-containing protein [Gemmatimonadota bacterium]
MPIFEYRCRDCGEEFECLVLHSSRPPRCPACHSKDLEKLISLHTVSSEHSRKRARQSARAHASGIRREKRHEDHKVLHDHLADDH